MDGQVCLELGVVNTIFTTYQIINNTKLKKRVEVDHFIDRQQHQNENKLDHSGGMYYLSKRTDWEPEIIIRKSFF